MTTPLFSIIVPLGYHRGKWERCWLEWQAQTLPKSQYEVILVVPPDFPEQEKLPGLLGPRARLEYSTELHDVGLCAVGAARARGQFLFFTESHCWPEPDILEKCLHAFTTHPEWAALSCRSIPITENRLARAEANMYQADIEHGLTVHPWRKILDHCFVTRRDRYQECGGLRSELGHFAEWALAAEYFGLGHQIGYLPEARLHHYYIGRLAELRAFTRDFITGEMKYLAKESRDHGGHLLEVPAEWICRGSWDPRLAQSLLRIAMHDMLTPSAARPRQPRMFTRTLVRWLMPAIVGEGAAQIGTAVKKCWALAAVNLAMVGPRARLDAAFKNYIASLIDHQRLECIKSERRARAKAATMPHVDSTSGWNVFAPENAGFYPIEVFQETRFRWSETAAIMSTWMPEGQHRIRIECLPVRSLVRGADLQFYFNERPLPAQDVSIGLETIEIKLDLDRSRHSTLAWTCRPFPAAGDRRWLGLPVKRIVSSTGRESSALKLTA
jgi:hypothetical protein